MSSMSPWRIGCGLGALLPSVVLLVVFSRVVGIGNGSVEPASAADPCAPANQSASLLLYPDPHSDEEQYSLNISPPVAPSQRRSIGSAMLASTAEEVDAVEEEEWLYRFGGMRSVWLGSYNSCAAAEKSAALLSASLQRPYWMDRGDLQREQARYKKQVIAQSKSAMRGENSASLPPGTDISSQNQHHHDVESPHPSSNITPNMLNYHEKMKAVVVDVVSAFRRCDKPAALK